MSDYVSSRLFYKFDPINKDFNFESKNGIVIDEDSLSPFNQINVELSQFDGEHRVSGVGSTTFSYQLLKDQRRHFTQNQTLLLLILLIQKIYGGISKIDLTYPGVNYSKIPKITNVISGIGTDVLFDSKSTKIGNILRNKFDSENIGFDYPTDETLRPVANLPEILEMQSLNYLDSIGISSFGRNYLNSPKLVVIDGYTNKVVP